MKNVHVAPFRRWLKNILIISALLIIVIGLYRSFLYSKIYRATPQMIVAQTDSGYVWGSSIETMKDEINAHIYLLNGCYQMSTFDVQNNTTISVKGNSWTGEAKLMLLDCNNNMTYYETISHETDTITVLSGSYQVLVVGYWFSGNVSLKIS